MKNDTVLVKDRRSRRSVPSVIGEIATHLALIVMLAFVLVPFYTVLISSFKSLPDILQPRFSWWPEGSVFHFDGYKMIFSTRSNVGGLGGGTLIKSLWNTLWMNLPPLVIGLVASSLAGFAYAKLDFPGKNSLFAFLIFTMMIPGCVTLVSTYLIYDTIGWTNTPLPIMIPGLFGSATNVFFMKQYVQGIPDELVEAAKIDGMNNIGIFFKIICPLSVPVFVSLGLLGFIGRYNDYLGPLLYLSDPDLYTLQIALRDMASMYRGEGQWQVILSACIVTMAPLILIYVFTQKYFIKGIAMSSAVNA